MPKKIRVYELARELGLENKAILALSEELKIGVKSHSSSVEDAQADRVRRLAREKGLAKSQEEIEAERRAEEERKRAAEAEKRERKVVRAGGAKAGPETEAPEDEIDAVARVVRSTVQTAPADEALTRAEPAPTPAREEAEPAVETGRRLVDVEGRGTLDLVIDDTAVRAYVARFNPTRSLRCIVPRTSMIRRSLRKFRRRF